MDYRKQLVFVVLLYFGVAIAFAQEEAKVGLVLSGGGAKGLAHIGAIKVLEEAGVQIDYVGGTSMGAIVGALYASGYSGQELDSIFRNTDFTTLIRDNFPRDAKTFYEKDDSERYALALPFNNFKISFPSAISSGQNIYNELVRLLFHVKDVEDFSQLPIPFFCIATNVETGDEVLLDRGYLPEAIMASGTLPTLFEPSELNGAILIDGGVVNNYPIQEVRKMGADIIIGVDVQHGLSRREALQSATEILLQINNYRTVEDMKEKSKQTDIYIRPDIEDFSVIDFDKKSAIIESGELAAQEVSESLKAIAQQQKREKIKVNPIMPKDSITIGRLILKGNDNYTRGYVKGKLRFALNERTTFDKIQKGIGNLSATGNFKTIRYKLAANGDSVDLILKLKEKPNKTFIRMGAHYDDLYKSAALINLTKKNFLMNDDVASFDFILGDNVRYNLEYYVDKGSYWSFGFNSKFDEFEEEVDLNVIRSNFPVSDDITVNAINLDVTELTNQFYIQSVWQEEFALTLGVEHRFVKYSTRTFGNLPNNQAAPGFLRENGRTFFDRSAYYSAYGQLKLDTYDDKYFPTKGLYFDGDFHFFILSSDFRENFKEFSVSKARLGAAFPLFRNLSLNLETEGGFKLGTSGVTSFDFILGGYGGNLANNFTPFLGYDFLSLPGNSFVKGYARLDYEFLPKNHLLFAANFANVADDIFRTGEWFDAPDFSGFGAGYGWESFIGPMQVIYSWSPELSNGRLFFSIGYWF
ncbi:patatin-like phospholipase family protein [Spongiimicrobium salis]|uniref:patatin-like phospholipase family protein n=1 Tax=Spongiimicrobium salis TaxID=1667022 RepID=UPI00374D86B8